jgi:hypothetical protein
MLCVRVHFKNSASAIAADAAWTRIPLTRIHASDLLFCFHPGGSSIEPGIIGTGVRRARRRDTGHSRQFPR